MPAVRTTLLARMPLLVGMLLGTWTSPVLAYSSSSSSVPRTTPRTRGASTTTTTALLASTQTHDVDTDDHHQDSTTRWIQALQQRRKQRTAHRHKKNKSNCGPCPDDDSTHEDGWQTLLSPLTKDSNHDHSQQPSATTGRNNHAPTRTMSLDRRQAAFAMAGMLWATATSTASPAHATYGADAKLELPDVLGGISDRATKQCLVESLGTRQCLVYVDPDNQLYQGANTAALLQKVDHCSSQLSRIGPLVEERKWSQIQGVISGPMGDLLPTLVLLAPLSTQNVDKSKQAYQKVKIALFSISDGVTRKDSNAVVKATENTAQALAGFVQSL